MDQAPVFVSYSRKQFYIAEYLSRTLEQKGLSTWLDVQKIQPGTDWQTSIDHGLATCRALVLVASRTAYQSAAVQYEVSTARAAGKPIYLAVIEDTPYVAQLGAVATVVDCQSQFTAGAAAIAQLIQTGELPKLFPRTYRRAHAFSLRMPFGRVKYLQLLCLSLAFLLGVVGILLRQQVIIQGAFTARALPFLVLVVIPAAIWVVSFVYSLLLLRAFRRQRRVTYLELELWPALNIFLFPLLFIALFFLSTQDFGPCTASATGAFSGAAVAIRNLCSGPTFAWQLVCLFGAIGLYLAFLACTLRGWLALAWIPISVIFGISSLPAVVLPLALLIIIGSVVFLSMRGFLNGHDIPLAFGEQAPRSWLSLRVGTLFSPAPPNRIFPLSEWRAWGRWLSPGAFPNEAFVRTYQSTGAEGRVARTGRVKTWRLSYLAADASSVPAIRRLLAEYPELRETTLEQADYQLALLSNKTPCRWIDTLAARYPALVCIIVSSLDFSLLASTLQQHQWIDYRQQRPYQIHNLAKALTGAATTINPTTPENFARTVGPYPFRLVVNALRMGATASVVLGAAAQLIAITDRVALVPFPLIITSVVVGMLAWWEAGQLLARNALLPELLLIWGATVLTLICWVVSGAVRTLVPREISVRNGTYNTTLANGLLFLIFFAGLPFLLFLVIGGVELVRNSEMFSRWLPRPTWLVWQRTLAVAPWRRLDYSLVLYAAATLTLIATLVVNSPYRYQNVHEYDVTTGDTAVLSDVLAGPDGNLWFYRDNSQAPALDNIGSLAPNGAVRHQRITIPQPAGCQESSFDCFSISGLRFGPDHNLWYVATQGFKRTEIHRATLAGMVTRFPLPQQDLSSVTFAFDAQGDLWFTSTANGLSEHQQAWIGRLDPTGLPGAITEYALPAQSLPTAIVAGPDGNMWFFDDGTHAIGKITPLGALTEYPLPYRGVLAGTASEEMIRGTDNNLWFADPRAGEVGRVTSGGAITTYDDEGNSDPHVLLAAPGGGIWFSDTARQSLGHIPLGGKLVFYPLHAAMLSAPAITVGPDGAIWVALYNQIGRVTAAGAVVLYDVPTLDANLVDIVTGSDQHLWFVEYDTGIIGELIP